MGQNDKYSEIGNVHDSSLPTKTFQLDEVFQPSATMTETDWFILDENGRRRRKMSKDEIEEVKHIIEENTSTETQRDVVPTTTENVQMASEESSSNAENNVSTEDPPEVPIN